MREQDQLRAFPLLLSRWDFLLLPVSRWESSELIKISQGKANILNLISIEILYTIDDHPGNRAAKVYELVHGEGHDSSCEHIVLHESVPCSPQTFEDIEVDVVFRDFVESAPIGVGGRVEEGGRGRVPYASD